MAKKKVLTPKQRKFVAAALEPGVSQMEAVKKAGYLVKNDKNASVMAAQLMNNPAVQASMDAMIADEYPEAGNEAIRYLKNKMRDPESSHREIMDCIDRLAKYKGWDAPKKTAHLRADVSTRFKLPGDDDAA